MPTTYNADKYVPGCAHDDVCEHRRSLQWACEPCGRRLPDGMGVCSCGEPEHHPCHHYSAYFEWHDFNLAPSEEIDLKSTLQVDGLGEPYGSAAEQAVAMEWGWTFHRTKAVGHWAKGTRYIFARWMDMNDGLMVFDGPDFDTALDRAGLGDVYRTFRGALVAAEGTD